MFAILTDGTSPRPSIYAAGGTNSATLNGGGGIMVPFARKISGKDGAVSWTQIYTSRVAEKWTRITAMKYHANYLYYIF